MFLSIACDDAAGFLSGHAPSRGLPHPLPADLRIDLTRNAGPAPLGVHAHITSDTATEEELRSIWRDCLILWDFGADEDYTYQHLPADTRAVRTARRKQGPFTGHAFRTVGETTITCTVIHPAALDSPVTLTSPAINVQDPDTVHNDAWTDSAGDNTVDGDADGTHNAGRGGNHTGVISLAETPDWTGAPANALRFTTLNAALDWLVAKPEFSRRRLLFKAGETYELARSVGLQHSSFVGRWGTGDNPIIRRKADWYDGKETDVSFWQSWDEASKRIGLLAAAYQCTFDRLAFRGDYSPVDPPIFPEGGTYLDAGWDELTNPISMANNDHDVTIDRCSSIGLMALVMVGNSSSANSAVRGMIQNDNYCTDWWNYGSFATALTRCAYLGCAYTQNPNATRTGLRGGGDRKRVRNQPLEKNIAIHGPIREAWCDRNAVYACHLDSRTSWSASDPALAPGGEQPCIRWMTSSYSASLHGPGIQLMSSYCGGSHLRGGGGIVTAAATLSEKFQASRGMPMLDGNYMEMGFNTSTAFQTAYSEATARNLVIVRPDYGAEQQSFGDPTPAANDTGFTLIRIGNGEGGNAQNVADPTGNRVRIANIVARIDAATSTDFFWPIGAGYWGPRPEIELGSSVVYSPDGWSTFWGSNNADARFGIVRVSSLDDLGSDLQPGASVAGVSDGAPGANPAWGYETGTQPSTPWDFFGALRTPGRTPFSDASDLTVWDGIPTHLNGLTRLPAAWAAANFTLGPLIGGLRVTLGTPPSSGATAATALEYRIDGGSWVDSGLTAPFESGDSFDVTGLSQNSEVTVALRWTNAEGYSVAGETRTVTTAGDLPAATAMGGTSSDITDTEDYTLWTFTGDGTLTVTQGGEIEYRMVGAGGGGGDARNANGVSGGGGGGRVVEGSLLLQAGDVLTITVPPSPPGVAGGNRGSQGDDATIVFGGTTYRAQGGGGGGSPLASGAATAGWHGGGGGGRTNASSGGGGNAGGDGRNGSGNDKAGGGGGGAGGSGGDATSTRGGDGGPGVLSTFSGVAETWGAGGGGGRLDWGDVSAGYGGDRAVDGPGFGGRWPNAWASNDGKDGVNPGWGGGGGVGNGHATHGGGGRGGPGRVLIRYRR